MSVTKSQPWDVKDDGATKGRNRHLLREFMRMLQPQDIETNLKWVSRDLAIGAPEATDGWLGLRARGVRAVVDLSQECSALGPTVRDAGMRYLRLPVPEGGLPEAEELHIVARWVIERIAEAGAVLIHDPAGRGSDTVVACAVLIKKGGNAARVRAQINALSENPLNEPQVTLLQRFIAQHVIAANGG
jgi:Polymorphic toxin system, DSP-PTPase phosphatase